ncbi:MAG: DeoR family transcriptional regulator [Bacteroidales bacterium]|nr:DeoR family transcriptional regulator [Bacteroidales bacterium]
MQSDIRVSTTELAVMFSVTQRTIKRDIDFLKKHDMIKRMGNEKSGYWLVLI